MDGDSQADANGGFMEKHKGTPRQEWQFSENLVNLNLWLELHK